eukprot:Hpha_TRINITY_DN16896_c0_g5::TRINITY_DN16896_c0_g5_i1::g.149210::m.149210
MSGEAIIRELRGQNEQLKAELKEERRQKDYFRELIDRTQDPTLIRLAESSPAESRQILGTYDALIAQLHQRIEADSRKIASLEQEAARRPVHGHAGLPVVGDENGVIQDLRLQLADAVERLRIQEKQNAEQQDLLITLGDKVEEARVFERQSALLAAEGKRHLSEVEQYRTQLDACRRRLEDVQSEETRLKQENQRLKGEQDKGDKTLRERDMRFSRVADECQTLRDAHEDGRRKLESAAREIERLGGEVGQRNVRIADLETNLKSQEKRWVRLDQTFEEFRQRVHRTFESEQERRRREMESLNKQHKSHTENMQEQLRTEEVEKTALQANLAQAKFNLQLERDDRTVRTTKEDPPDGVLAEQLESLHLRLSAVTQDRDDLQRHLDSLKQEHRRARREAEQEIQKARVSEEAAVRKARDQERIASERTEELGESVKEVKRLHAKIRQQSLDGDEGLRKAHEEVQALRVESSAQIQKLKGQRDEQEQGRRSDKKRLEQTAREAEEEARALRDELGSERRLREEDLLRHREELATLQRKRKEAEMQLEEATKVGRGLRAEKGLLEVKCERLRKGIDNIKNQLKSTDSKLGEVAGSREQLRVELRDSQLALEQERLERKRVSREFAMVEQEQERYRASLAYWEGEAARLQEREQQRPLLRIGEGRHAKATAQRTRRRRHSETRGAALPDAGE